MKTFLYKGKEYSSLWQIRNVAPELVFCDTTPASLLELIGITVKETPDPEPDPAETARRELEAKIAQIDSETSQAIQAGFDYAINGETYHFPMTALTSRTLRTQPARASCSNPGRRACRKP